MAKQNKSYSEFQSFVRQHQGINRTQIYNKFKESGGKIDKGKAFEIIRSMSGIEKGAGRNKPVVVRQAYKVPSLNQKQQKKRNNYIKFDKKIDVQYRSMESPAIRIWKKNINALYGNNKTQFIQVQLSTQMDDYTKQKHFSIFVPYDGKNNIGIKTLAKGLIKSLKTYYKNLARRYKDLLADTSGEVLSMVEAMEHDFKNAWAMDENDLKQMFESYGFNIGEMNIFKFTQHDNYNNEDLEDEDE